ncbi:MAG: protein kinase [Vicinamibacterales bacterium]
MVGLDARQLEADGPAPEWDVVTLIGEGPNGRMYLAEERAPGRRMVAVKIIAALDSPEAARARLEAVLPDLKSLAHPNIAAVIGGGTTAEGAPYLVSEYVPAVSLECALARAPIAIEVRLLIAKRVAAALEYAHARAQAHGHVAGTNVLLPGRSPLAARLVDHGAAGIAGRTATVGGDVTAILELIRTLLPEIPALCSNAVSAAEICALVDSEIRRQTGN